MKARIFLYLFIFAFMYSIFQFMNTKRYSEAKEKEIAKLHEKIHFLEADNATYKMDLEKLEDDGFSLQTNPKSREYFEDQGMDVDSLAGLIESEIISKNDGYKDHPLVPYPGMEGGVMRINRIKILNHRWVLAEFTDGAYWGEALISYFLDEDNKLEFDTVDGVIYPK